MEDVSQCNVCNEYKSRNDSLIIRNIENTICISCAQTTVENQ